MQVSPDQVKQNLLASFNKYHNWVSRSGYSQEYIRVAEKRRNQRHVDMYREISTGKFFDGNGYPIESASDRHNFNQKGYEGNLTLDARRDKSRFQNSNDPEFLDQDWCWTPDRYGSDTYSYAARCTQHAQFSTKWIEALIGGVDKIVAAIQALPPSICYGEAICSQDPSQPCMLVVATQAVVENLEQFGFRRGWDKHEGSSLWTQVLDPGPSVDGAMRQAIGDLHGLDMCGVGY